MRLNERQFQTMTRRVNPTPAKRKTVSAGEATLALQLQAVKIEYEREFKFCPDRKWRADFRISDTKILVEVEGGIWSGGRHTRGSGFEKDCEKYNWAAANGWIVLRYSTRQVMAGEAAKGIVNAMGERA